MAIFNRRAASVRGNINSLEAKIKDLDEGLKSILQRTESLLTSMRHNEELLTVFEDSARLGLSNLKALPSEMLTNPLIEATRSYLEKVLDSVDNPKV